jgi:Zn-dependent protease with chaperone function
VTTLVLASLAVCFSGPAPGLLARLQAARRAPRAAMTLWQSVALAAVLSALGAGVSLATATRTAGFWGYGVAPLALLLTLVVLARLLVSGHRVGTRLRGVRRRHRAMLDLLGAEEGRVRVVDHDRPLAYCLPGVARSRVVVSAGARSRLAEQELAAVLAHERAHLRARHDLVLEAFTVLHEAFPRVVSSRSALREVRLLVEVLADRAARRTHGARPLARALVALADSSPPTAALGVTDGGTVGDGAIGLVERVALLGDDRPHRLLAALLYLAAVTCLAAPALFLGVGNL